MENRSFRGGSIASNNETSKNLSTKSETPPTKSRPSNAYLTRLHHLLRLPRKTKYTCVSLFCGGGGLDLGFACAGFKIVYSSDVEATYCETIRANLKKDVVEPYDIRDLRGADIVKKAGRNIDFIIGGPPCQAFSILGDRGSVSDPRGKLVYDYVRVVKELQPLGFLFENVPGILTLNGGNDWKKLSEYFASELRYNLHWTKLNAVEFGVPQFRERVFLLGFKKKLPFQWPQPTYAASQHHADLQLLSPVTVRMAFQHMRSLPNHVKRVHCDRVKCRYRKLSPGERDRVDHTDRIRLDRPSGTVLVGSGGGGGRPFIHPIEPRHLTVREAARLQSFPDWWEFRGGSTAQYRQVGNAVPPLLAFAIGRSITKSLSRKS